jgi:Anti-sigma-K factor rskA/Putative zinc-finger
MSTCQDPIATLLPVYLLSALDESDSQQVKAHLVSCAACQREFKLLAPARQVLLTEVQAMPAPERLKASIMNTVNAEASLFASAQHKDEGKSVNKPGKLSRFLRLRVPLAGLALPTSLACLALALFILPADKVQPSARQYTAIISSTDAPKASGELIVEGKQASLSVAGMPSAGPGRIYQVWLKKPGLAPQPTDSLFGVRSNGHGRVAIDGLPGATQVLVTSEPVGGSSSPTRTPVLQVDLV